VNSTSSPQQSGTTTSNTSEASLPVVASAKAPTSPLAIQIEVDIDPPPSGPGGLSDEKLEKLGLPTHHVHFTAASSQQVKTS
jgi:hypothetical protein